jgi:hypothetical protein
MLLLILISHMSAAVARSSPGAADLSACAGATGAQTHSTDRGREGVKNRSYYRILLSRIIRILNQSLASNALGNIVHSNIRRLIAAEKSRLAARKIAATEPPSVCLNAVASS